MRVRSILVLASLAAVALAGCADTDGPLTDVDGGPEGLLDPTGLVHSHPDYLFGTNAALFESPDGSARLVHDNGTVQWFKPPHRGLPGAISGLEPLRHVEGVDAGHGIAVFGSYVFTGGRSSGPLHVVDISDPAEATIVGTAGDVPVRDADTILFPDGRLVLITTAGGKNIFATDVTDPTKPKLIGQFETPAGNHNIAVVPGTPIVYNTGTDDHINIVDFSEPENPVYVGDFTNGNRCHDIAFHINTTAGKVWAICAGYGQTEIWDIQNPFAPEMVVEIDYPSIDKGIPVVGGELDDAGAPQDVASPARQACEATVDTSCGRVSAAHPNSFSHLAILNHDASVLIMGDETGGGGSNQCDFYYEGSDGTTYSGPIGNLWFYDLTDPKNPDLRGHVSPAREDAEGSCTAHFGKVIGRTDYLVMAFYTAGLTLVDFGDLDNPRIVERWDEGGSIWDVWYHQGYLVTGDMGRGMDVLALS